MIEQACLDKEFFEQWTRRYFAHRRAEAKDVPNLMASIEYSFFSGGKRFRPLLCFAVADALKLKRENIIAFAVAVELIHTYSLIHDDLPCMDNDDERRGQPTNHIQFSEDLALLAGDALLTEAFKVVADHLPGQCSTLVSMLSESAGLNGMIRGQVLDLGQGSPVTSLSDLINLHELKTGRLIALCFQGPAAIGGLNPTPFYELGLLIGLAFQVKDDLLDIDENDQASFLGFLNKEGTESHLESLTEKIQLGLRGLDLDTQYLEFLVNFNLNRNQ